MDVRIYTLNTGRTSRWRLRDLQGNQLAESGEMRGFSAAQVLRDAIRYAKVKGWTPIGCSHTGEWA